MTHHDQSSLVKLGDSDFVLEDRAQDIRGFDVYDRDGKEIGSVEGLYVDTEEREVRFLDVGAGGFLGVGEKHFLIPVEAITDFDEDGVTIDQDLERVTDSPALPTNVVPAAEYQREVYDYYGYEYPAWARW